MHEYESPKEREELFAIEELLEQLSTSVDYFHQLPPKERVTCVTNADLYHQMLLVSNILNRLYCQVYR